MEWCGHVVDALQEVASHGVVWARPECCAGGCNTAGKGATPAHHRHLDTGSGGHVVAIKPL